MQLSYDDLLKSVLSVMFGGGMVGGFWAWVRSRPRGQADVQTSQAAFQAALSEQSNAFTEALMAVVDRQQKRIDQQAARIDELDQLYHDAHGENRQLRQIIRSLVHRLKAEGIDLPADLDVAAILQTDEDGVASMAAVSFKPTRRKRS